MLLKNNNIDKKKHLDPVQTMRRIATGDLFEREWESASSEVRFTAPRAASHINCWHFCWEPKSMIPDQVKLISNFSWPSFSLPSPKIAVPFHIQNGFFLEKRDIFFQQYFFQQRGFPQATVRASSLNSCTIPHEWAKNQGHPLVQAHLAKNINTWAGSHHKSSSWHHLVLMVIDCPTPKWTELKPSGLLSELSSPVQ